MRRLSGASFTALCALIDTYPIAAAIRKPQANILGAAGLANGYVLNGALLRPEEVDALERKRRITASLRTSSGYMREFERKATEAERSVVNYTKTSAWRAPVDEEMHSRLSELLAFRKAMREHTTPRTTPPMFFTETLAATLIVRVGRTVGSQGRWGGYQDYTRIHPPAMLPTLIDQMRSVDSALEAHIAAIRVALGLSAAPDAVRANTSTGTF